MGEVILTMKDIDKSFPGVHALDHVNFEVKRGDNSNYGWFTTRISLGIKTKRQSIFPINQYL